MTETRLTAIEDLDLDLKNFRTVPQQDEHGAVKAMISISPDRFWALLGSLLDTGYLPTENIIVLKSGKTKLTVKEGNRRIAALKICYGIIDPSDFNIPSNLQEKINNLSPAWKKENKSVPCSLYDKTDATLVDKIVSLAHGKGEKASRDQWTSVARARHNRDMSKLSEPILDLLETYLAKGSNITGQQKDRWSGDYPLTVLDEAVHKILSRIKISTAEELVKQYSKSKYKAAIEEIIREIGVGGITFPSMRGTVDVFAQYGIPSLPTSSSQGSSSSGNQGGSGTSSTGSGQGTSSGGKKTSTSSGSASGGSKAYPISDPKTVKATLKKFNPQGPNRQKVATLKNEALALDISKTPIAFCFILRSMFEISAKAYCDDHRIATKTTKKKKTVIVTQDKPLVELLNEATAHLTKNNTDQAKVKLLHGARTELARRDGILSVTSMNHLVHSPSFSIATGDICTLFGNIYPLLEFLN